MDDDKKRNKTIEDGTKELKYTMYFFTVILVGILIIAIIL
jgi:hypothetical protein